MEVFIWKSLDINSRKWKKWAQLKAWGMSYYQRDQSAWSFNADLDTVFEEWQRGKHAWKKMSKGVDTLGWV